MSNHNNRNFEYENEESINQNLICGICTDPFIDPVETPCHHSFCLHCLNIWLNTSGSTCPTCRKLVTKRNVNQITVRSFLSMLDQLTVKCQLCEESNIERGNYSDHARKQCPKVHVYCKAKVSGCAWTGLREELSIHFESCTFKQDGNRIQNQELVEISELFECPVQPSNNHPSTSIFQRRKNIDGTVTMLIDQNIITPSEDKLLQAVIELITHNQCDTLEFDGYSFSSENLSIIAATLTKDRSIKTLDFSYCSIDDNRIRSFAGHLPFQTCLTCLNLNGNYITDYGMSSISIILLKNHTLNRLVLTRNRIGNEGVRLIANLFYNDSIQLKELCIGSNHLITDECRSSIYTLIRWHQNLTLLKIENTGMSYYSLTLFEMFLKMHYFSNLQLVV